MHPGLDRQKWSPKGHVQSMVSAGAQTTGAVLGTDVRVGLLGRGRGLQGGMGVASREGVGVASRKGGRGLTRPQWLATAGSRSALDP
jgi:hypothetical protein